MRWVVLGTGLLGAALLEELRGRDAAVLALDHAAIDAAGGIARAGAASIEHGTIVINAAALTNVDACEDRAAEAMRVNGEEPGLLARACHDAGARLVHVSTDSVLEITNVYAKSKALGEARVREEMGEEALIVRVSTVFAPHPRRSDFVRFVVKTLREKGRADAAHDMLCSPTYAIDAARAIVAAAQADARGTQAFVNEESISRYELARLIQHVWQAPGEVRAVPMDSLPFRAPRPRNATMRATMDAWHKPMPLDAALVDYRARWS